MPVMSLIRNVVPFSLALALGLAGCMDDQVAGSTTTGNTGKGAIAGRVVDAGGNGVAGARVRVVPVDHNPGPGGSDGIADIVTSGADGTFTTDSLPDGSYNLISDKGGSLAFRDSVPVRSDSGTDAGTATLRAPGSVAGVVRLRAGHDSRTMFLILLGTPSFVVPKDSIGNFRLGPLAEGTYRLRLLSTLDDYRPMDTAITVQSGVEAVLPDTLRPFYQGTGLVEPLPVQATLRFDTTLLQVTLTWPRSADSRVAAYHVYRREADAGYVRLTETPQTDTTFTEDWKAGIWPGVTYHYAVTALDSLGNEGRKAGPAVLAMTSRFHVDTVMALEPSSYPHRMDIAPDGAGWQIGADTLDGTEVMRYGISGEISSIGDVNLFPHGIHQIALDTAGDLYALTPSGQANPSYLLLGKYSPAGVRQWQVQVPYTFHGFSRLKLQRDGEAVSVWNALPNILVTLGRDGRIIARDSLQVPVESQAAYKPGIGFYTVRNSGLNSDTLHIEFRNLEGRIVSSWNHRIMSWVYDLEQDGEGRWYILFQDEMHVFSPQRGLLGVLPLYGDQDMVLWRRGALYFQEQNGGLIRIELSP